MSLPGGFSALCAVRGNLVVIPFCPMGRKPLDGWFDTRLTAKIEGAILKQKSTQFLLDPFIGRRGKTDDLLA